MSTKNNPYIGSLGFVLIYFNSYGEVRSMVLDASTLRDAIDIAIARGITRKDIIAISKINRLEVMYKKDLKELTKNFGYDKGKGSHGKTV